MVYTIQRQNDRLGPYTLDQVRDLAQSGALLPTDLVWTEGAPAPLTVATLLQGGQSDATGGMDRSQLRDGDTQLPADQRLTVPTDVLVPAAMSYCIDDSNQVDGEAHRRGRQHAGAA